MEKSLDLPEILNIHYILCSAMPRDGDYVYAKDPRAVLKKKHAAKAQDPIAVLKKKLAAKAYRKTVLKRTGNRTNTYSSHVMQYVNTTLRRDFLSAFVASNVFPHKSTSTEEVSSPSVSGYHSGPVGSLEKLKAKRQLDDEISRRKHVDCSINQIGKLLFGQKKSLKVLNNVRSPGQAVVDDWHCLKKLLRPSIYIFTEIL
ncbi:vacuolar-processing enzyme [Ziziphus jujuba]|uniref:Vacuolar-processing enzyme n=1 Tax=Ziziphus jujuba TaxID=326968 RepID=A0ABM3I1E0_ZIZJJ|nr:vacuolar-processing enzyme [Ziziphus jujuba]